jgi:LPXTG-motif cell wall-anchored protein
VGTAGNAATVATSGSGDDNSHDSGGCGCSTVGSPVHSTGWAGAGLLGALGLMVAKRRRRRSA